MTMTMGVLRLRSIQAARSAGDSKNPFTTEGGDDNTQRRIQRSATFL